MRPRRWSGRGGQQQNGKEVLRRVELLGVGLRSVTACEICSLLRAPVARPACQGQARMISTIGGQWCRIVVEQSAQRPLG